MCLKKLSVSCVCVGMVCVKDAFHSFFFPERRCWVRSLCNGKVQARECVFVVNNCNNFSMSLCVNFSNLLCIQCISNARTSCILRFLLSWGVFGGGILISRGLCCVSDGAKELMCLAKKDQDLSRMCEVLFLEQDSVGSTVFWCSLFWSFCQTRGW